MVVEAGSRLGQETAKIRGRVTIKQRLNALSGIEEGVGVDMDVRDKARFHGSVGAVLSSKPKIMKTGRVATQINGSSFFTSHPYVWKKESNSSSV